MSDELKATAFSNLIAMQSILNELGIMFWLDGGTLLGAYRDGDFCEDDENDVDLSCWASDKHKIDALIARAQAAGFRLYHHWTGDPRAPGMAQEVSFTKAGCKIDVFFQEVHASGVVWHLIYKHERGTPVVVPAELLDGFMLIGFRGGTFLCPARIEEYLTYRYGDWRTPIHRSDYSSQNVHQFQGLQPGWRFYE